MVTWEANRGAQPGTILYDFYYVLVAPHLISNKSCRHRYLSSYLAVHFSSSLTFIYLSISLYINFTHKSNTGNTVYDTVCSMMCSSSSKPRLYHTRCDHYFRKGSLYYTTSSTAYSDGPVHGQDVSLQTDGSSDGSGALLYIARTVTF